MDKQPFWITESLRLSNERMKTLRQVVHRRGHEGPEEKQLELPLWQ